jgi:hypothetical protein
MKTIDRILACVLILGGFGHAAGSVLGYRHEPLTLLWALSASLFSLLVAAVNLLRAVRPTDRPLAWIACVASVALSISALMFGFLIGNPFDARALVNGLVALALAGFSLKTALGNARARS